MVRSVRVYLIALVGISLALASCAFLVVFSSTNEVYKAQLESQTLETAKNLSRSVDLELQRATGILLALRASEAAKKGDWEGLAEQARATVSNRDTWIIVHDRAGRQVVNTRLPSGASLPRSPPPEAMWRAFSDGKPRVCDLVRGAIEPSVTCVDMPLTARGASAYAISMMYSPRAFRDIVTWERVSSGHIASLVDRRGTVIWRNRNPDAFVGKSASGAVLEAVRQNVTSRVAETVSLEGIRVLTALDRSRTSGWTVVVGIPMAQIEAAQTQAYWRSSLVAVIALAVGCLLAAMVARRLANAVTTLTANVASAGQAEASPTYIKEFDEAAAAITAIEAARADSDRRRQILIGELNHRVKNSLAIVQSLAHRTFSNRVSLEESLTAFDGRLGALAAAHNLLTQRSWESAGMLQLVKAALVPFCTAERCSVDGPDFELAAQSAVSVALALHELGTNAAKYGALSHEGGHVSVHWRVTGDRLALEWIETGGAEVRKPEREGFGTKLIKRVLATDLKAEVEFDFKPEGLRFHLTATLPRYQKPVDLGEGVHITSSLAG